MSTCYGKYRGIVEDVRDPEGRGRVRVRCPVVFGEGISNWALPSVPYSSPGIGLFRVPPVGTQVWVEFEAGDPSFPIYSGCYLGPDEEELVDRAAENLGVEPLLQVVQPNASWPDLILPDSTLDAIREIAGSIGHRETVFEEWELARRLGWSSGVMSVFAGPPGTGKTLAAEVLANELGTDLYRVDLSAA